MHSPRPKPLLLWSWLLLLGVLTALVLVACDNPDATNNPDPTAIVTTAPALTVITKSPTFSSNPFFTAQNDRTPLGWAQLLAQNVKSTDTDYRHKDEVVTWTGQAGATVFTSRTDCSGLFNALLTQAYGLTGDDFQRWLATHRPLAKTYYEAIVSQHGFQQIPRLNEVQPGDVIAIKYPPGAGGDDTGHFMLVAGTPQLHKSSQPEIANTQQWDILIIDSSESGHGSADTRHLSGSNFRQGLGEGTFRVYTDPDGKMVGYAWSDFTDSEYYSLSARPLAIGRLNLQFKLG